MPQWPEPAVADRDRLGPGRWSPRCGSWSTAGRVQACHGARRPGRRARSAVRPLIASSLVPAPAISWGVSGARPGGFADPAGPPGWPSGALRAYPGQPVRRERRIERQVPATCFHDREQAADRLDAALEVHADQGLRACAQLPEVVGEPVRRLIELAIGQRRSPGDDGGRAGPAGCCSANSSWANRVSRECGTGCWPWSSPAASSCADPAGLVVLRRPCGRWPERYRAMRRRWRPGRPAWTYRPTRAASRPEFQLRLPQGMLTLVVDDHGKGIPHSLLRLTQAVIKCFLPRKCPVSSGARECVMSH